MTRPLLIVSPFAPTENGIADYVAELLPYHAEEYEPYLVIANDQPVPVFDGVPVKFLRETEVLESKIFEDADYIYHIGNNPDHVYALKILVERPGIVVLHDFCLSYLLEAASQNVGSWDIYRRWAQHDYGDYGAILSDDFLAMGWRGRFMAFELALNGIVLANATALIVHSRYSQFKAAARRPGLPVHYLPHHVSQRARDARRISREDARRRLGLPESQLIISALGFVTRPKLIDRSLASLARIRAHVPDFSLVIAGERRPHEYDVNADIAASGLSDRVICTDYLSEDDFFLHLAAADIILNMRFPIGGESSGTLARGIGCGRACIVLDYGPMGEMPDGAVAKIPFGPNLDAVLDQTLLNLLTEQSVRQNIEREALKISAEWTPQASATRYHAIIEENSARRSAVVPGVSLTARGRTTARSILLGGKFEAVRSYKSLWWRYPIVFGNEKSGNARILCVDESGEGRYCLEHLFDWPAEAISSVGISALLAGEDDQNVYDAALLVLDAAVFEKPEDVYRAIAGRLRWGAALVVELIDSASPGDSNAPQAHNVLTALGCSETHLFSESDLAPELEDGLNRRLPNTRFVGIGLRSSDAVALSPSRGSGTNFRRAGPIDGSWMLK